MTATRAGRAGARAGSHGAGDSNTLGCRDDRRTLAHISGASSLGFLAAEFIERPRIFHLGGLGLAEIEFRAVRRCDGGHSLAGGLLGLLDQRANTRLARFGRFGRLGWLGRLGQARGARNEKAPLKLARRTT